MRSDCAASVDEQRRSCFYALRSGLCVATEEVVNQVRAERREFLCPPKRAMRSDEFCPAQSDCAKGFLCPPKRAMRSDDFLDSTHGSIPMGFYALRSGLCVATEELKNAGETNLEFLCPPKRAMRSDGARTAAWCCAAAFLCPPKRAMRSDAPTRSSREMTPGPCFYALRSGLCVATRSTGLVRPEGSVSMPSEAGYA